MPSTHFHRDAEGVADSPASRRAFASLLRKLYAWELSHLRDHCAELHHENEKLSAQVDQLKRELEHAEDCAASWRDDVLQMMEAGVTVGLTKSGRVVALGAEVQR